MARLARIVAPGRPHHVTARGNRREPIFFEDGDQEVYRDLLAGQARRGNVEVWAYCLMPNHVHLVLTPRDEFGLGLAVGEAHLMAAVRYVALNPVRARLVARAEDWPWSSTRAPIRALGGGRQLSS